MSGQSRHTQIGVGESRSRSREALANRFCMACLAVECASSCDLELEAGTFASNFPGSKYDSFGG